MKTNIVNILISAAVASVVVLVGGWLVSNAQPGSIPRTETTDLGNTRFPNGVESAQGFSVGSLTIGSGTSTLSALRVGGSSGLLWAVNTGSCIASVTPVALLNPFRATSTVSVTRFETTRAASSSPALFFGTSTQIASLDTAFGSSSGSALNGAQWRVGKNLFFSGMASTTEPQGQFVATSTPLSPRWIAVGPLQYFVGEWRNAAGGFIDGGAGMSKNTSGMTIEGSHQCQYRIEWKI